MLARYGLLDLREPIPLRAEFWRQSYNGTPREEEGNHMAFVADFLPEQERMRRQMQFVLEIDRLKKVNRKTQLLDGTRPENSAEHSWHIAVMAMLLAEHAQQRLDLERVLKMLLIHDIVEIDSGNSFCYDETALHSQADRERVAAERLFGILPDA